MAINPISRPQGRPILKKPAHESKDTSVGWIIGIVVFLFLCGMAIHLMLGGMLIALQRTPAPTDQWRPANVDANRRAFVQAQFPKLQTNPNIDLKELHAREDAELNSYGWVDKGDGTVRIPIERAMDLLLQKGFPGREGTNQIKTGPSSFELEQQRPLQREKEKVK